MIIKEVISIDVEAEVYLSLEALHIGPARATLEHTVLLASG